MYIYVYIYVYMCMYASSAYQLALALKFEDFPWFILCALVALFHLWNSNFQVAAFPFIHLFKMF